MARATNPLPDQDVLLRLLIYDAESGFLVWRARPLEMFKRRQDWISWNKRWAGKRALASKDAYGYNTGRLFDCPVKAHRVIWKLVFGEEPADIDHINGVPGDDWLGNLRSVGSSKNQQNRKRLNSNNSTGKRGVWRRSSGVFVAEIGVSGRKVHLGTFKSVDEAALARSRAEEMFWESA